MHMPHNACHVWDKHSINSLMQIEIRKAESGQLIFKDSMSASVAAIVKGDYRGDGAEQVVVCAVNGEVRLCSQYHECHCCTLLGNDLTSR